MKSSPIAPKFLPRSKPLLAIAHRGHEDREAGQVALFGEATSAPIRLPHVEPWPIAERLRREFDAVGFFLSGHPLDAFDRVLEKLRVERWANFSRAVKQGASAARLAATVLDRYERRTRTGSKIGIIMLSDQSGQYEAILFNETLNQYRDLLEKGASVLVTVQASVDGEDVRVRINAVEPLEQAAARIQKGLRIFLRDTKPLQSIEARLQGRGEGEVSLIVMLEENKSEVEIKLPGRFPVSAQIAGAIKAIPGIVAVEHV